MAMLTPIPTRTPIPTAIRLGCLWRLEELLGVLAALADSLAGKASLFGDQHMYGPEGINFFTRGKVVTSRWPDPRTSQVDLGFPQNR